MGLSILQCIRLHTSRAHVLCVYAYTLYTLYIVYAPLRLHADRANDTRRPPNGPLPRLGARLRRALASMEVELPTAKGTRPDAAPATTTHRRLQIKGYGTSKTTCQAQDRNLWRLGALRH